MAGFCLGKLVNGKPEVVFVNVGSRGVHVGSCWTLDRGTGNIFTSVIGSPLGVREKGRLQHETGHGRYIRHVAVNKKPPNFRNMQFVDVASLHKCLDHSLFDLQCLNAKGRALAEAVIV